MCDFARCERAADRLETVDGLVDAGNDRSDITLRLSTCKHLGVRIVDLRVTQPGQIALHRTFCFARSSATPFVKPTTPCFDAV